MQKVVETDSCIIAALRVTEEAAHKLKVARELPSELLLRVLSERGGHPGFVAEAVLLCVRKSADYNHGKGSDGMHMVDRSEYFPMGLASHATMISIKAQRFVSLSKKQLAGGSPEFEGLRDTSLDLINYCGFYGASLEDKT